MTKKDYICLARGLRFAYEHYVENGSMSDERHQATVLGFSNAIAGVMNALKSDNPNFNDTIFMNAITTGAHL